MRFTPKQYAQALFEALESVGPSEQDLVLDNFVKVLAENNDLRLFEQIAEEFHQRELAAKGIKQAKITSAHPITAENEKEILRELNKLVKADFELKKKVDENLIGGVMIQVDDKMLDASVKNNLMQLKKDLTQ